MRRPLAEENRRLSDTLRLAAAVFFLFGLGLALLGPLVTFFPGAECRWFLTAGAFVAFGLFVPNRAVRVTAVVGILVCLLAAYAGYGRGVDYQRRLLNRKTIVHDLSYGDRDGLCFAGRTGRITTGIGASGIL